MLRLILITILALTGCAYQVYPVLSEESPAPMREQLSYIPAEVVKSATRRAHSLFTYESDSVRGEWTNYGLELWLGVPFKGDCEDFALSVAHYLQVLGYDSRHMALATLAVGPTTAIYNHAVLIVTTEKGQLIVDNGSTRSVSVNFYDESSWHSMRRLDSEQWYEIGTK